MKRKLILLPLLLSAAAIIFCACGMQTDGSIKSITRPYIARYECVEARLGGEDFLQRFDFIKITLLDSEKLEVSFKYKDGEKHAYSCEYDFNTETREISAEIGILGFPYKESTKIENGKFTISKNFLGKELVLKFEMK